MAQPPGRHPGAGRGGRRHHGGTGSEVDGPEREHLWARLNQVVDYEAYQRKVSRRIAVVALTPA